jgi:hypothetical protein
MSPTTQELYDRAKYPNGAVMSEFRQEQGEASVPAVFADLLAARVSNPLTYITLNLVWIRQQLAMEEDRPVNRDEILRALDEALEGARSIAELVRRHRQQPVPRQVPAR